MKYNELKSQDKIETPGDGRIVAILILIIFSITFSFVAQEHSIVNTWRILGVKTAMAPHFADLRIILAGGECQREGIDPLVSNPCDPLKRILPYPRVWSVAAAASGLDQDDTNWLGLLMGACFLTVVFLMAGRISFVQGGMLGIMVISPPVLFALERGNIDLILFCLLAAGAYFLASGKRVYEAIGIGTILAAALLKYYPVFPLLVLGVLPQFRKLAWLAIGIFIFYFATHLEEFNLYNSGVSKGMNGAFGAIVLARHQNNSWFSVLSSPWNSINYAALSGFLLVASFFFTWLIHKKIARGFTMNIFKWEFILFCIGASVFTGCYLTSTSYNYRLIFLLFWLPQIFLWQSSVIKLCRFIGYFFWVTMILSFFIGNVLGQRWFLDNWLNLVLYFASSSVMLLGILQAQTMTPADLDHYKK